VRTAMWVCAVAMILGVAHAHDPRSKSVYRVGVSAEGDDLARIVAEGFDIAGRDLRHAWVEILTDETGLAWLERRGFAREILERRDGPRALRAERSPDVAQVVGPGYTNPVELESFLIQVHADHPAITRLEQIGSSVEGRPIWALMISDNAALDEDEPSVLFSGAHHAREVMSVEATMDVIEQLTGLYGTDPAVTARVGAAQIWCVPLANPDGVQIVFDEDDLWRKNARDNDGNGRINWKDGVDTNRNYEWSWGGACLGSSGTPSTATYRGPAQASEPETRSLIELARRVRPVFDVEYHSYGEDVFYAMGCDPLFGPTLDTIPGPDPSIDRVIAEEYAARLIQGDGEPGFLPAPFGNRVDGIGRDQQAHEHGSIAFVTELNSVDEGGFHPDYATWRDATVAGQRPGWSWLLDRIAGPAVGGHVVDAASGAPVQVDVALDQLRIRDGRRLTTRPDTGRFHILVVPGAYTLRVCAPGYVEGVLTLDVGSVWQPVVVALEPDGSTRLARTEFEAPSETLGWSVGASGDDADSGLWESGVPHGTHLGDAVSGSLQIGAPSFDRTPGTGKQAFVTGNRPAASFDEDAVTRGTTTLVSPAWNLAGWYGVEIDWHQWLRTDAADPLDGLRLEASTDGGATWVPLATWLDSSSDGSVSPAWVRERVRLDDVAAPASATRLRFRATDGGPLNVIEAAVDDLEIRGFSLTGQGRVAELRFPGSDPALLAWNPVPGAADATYEIARGLLDQLPMAGAEATLGPLQCFNAAGLTLLDPETPPPDSGWFYLVRFRLGCSRGDWGVGSDGASRQGDCPP